MMYDVRLNRIVCPICQTPMRPFGGRLTPGFDDVPEMFLCVACGYSVDLRLAVAEALVQKAALRRRAANARGYLVTQGYQLDPPSNGHKRPIRRWIVKRLVKLIDEQAAEHIA